MERYGVYSDNKCFHLRWKQMQNICKSLQTPPVQWIIVQFAVMSPSECYWCALTTLNSPLCRKIVQLIVSTCAIIQHKEHPTCLKQNSHYFLTTGCFIFSQHTKKLILIFCLLLGTCPNFHPLCFSNFWKSRRHCFI